MGLLAVSLLAWLKQAFLLSMSHSMTCWKELCRIKLGLTWAQFWGQSLLNVCIINSGQTTHLGILK